MTIKSCFVFISLAFIFQSCGDGTDSGDKDLSQSLTKMNGVYVSEGYATRDNGSDWMAVSVIPINVSQAQINIRSRVDNEKPATCTYAAAATIRDANILVGAFPENSIFFTFEKNQLNISGAAENDASFLNSFCLEGKSIEGSYTKLSEPLDDAQLLKGGFIKTLSMKGITYNIRASSTGSSNSLTIQPSGLTESNQKITTEIKGFITEAHIDDLNDDGWPELLLFIDLGKSKKTGTVLAYTAKDGKTLSPIEYPNTFESEKIGEGYMGQDKFSLVANNLVQEFPIHTPDGKLMGQTRQVLYKLVQRENAQTFEVDKVTDKD